MFEDAENLSDMFRGGLPYFLFALPLLLICSSHPALASSEFSVHRMSQYDVNGVYFGCRSSSLTLEAKSLFTWSTNRHCVVAKFEDITADQFREIRQKAGGLVLLLPKDVASMAYEEKEHLSYLELAIMEQPVTIPVYFSVYNAKLEDIIGDVTKIAAKDNELTNSSKAKTKQRESALNEIVDSISGNGYQIIVTGTSHANNRKSRIPIIQGELPSTKATNFSEGTTDASAAAKLPMIIVAAHLSTFGMYNDYPFNADAAVLLTLADMFSKLHNTSNAPLKYRILFLLTESGPLLNYQGAKKWLDENVQLQNVEFVLCLDSITQPLNGDNKKNLYMHVSKPPKENTPVNTFMKYLKYAANKFGNSTAESVHKKINLAEPFLAWHHERFSIKRLPSFTLSSLTMPKHQARTTLFKDNEDIILENTQRNAKVIAEALAYYIYANASPKDIEDFEIFSERLKISREAIKMYTNLKSSLQNNDLKNAFEKYLTNVKVIYDKPDVREPDFMLYEGIDATLNVYRVKPAIFDLFLTIIICAYLCCVHFVIQFFPNLYQIICKMSLKSHQLSPSHNNAVERNKTKSY